MQFTKRKYRITEWLRISFCSAPVCSVLLALTQVAGGLLPTLRIYATATFVDTALGIFKGTYSFLEIYPPLIFVAALEAYGWLSGLMREAAMKRLTLSLYKGFRLAITGKCARLTYAHIEDTSTWDILSRVFEKPEERAAEGYNNLLRIGACVIQVLGLVFALFSQAWWAAIVMVAFSVPTVLLSFNSGKKNYKAFSESSKYRRRAEYLSEVLLGRESGEERTLFGYTEELNKRWNNEFDEYCKINERATAKYYVRMRTTSVLFAVVGLFTVLALLPQVATQAVTVGMLIGLTRSVMDLSNAMSWNLSGMMVKLSEDREYFKDFSSFIALSEELGALDAPEYPERAPREIRFENVRFSYPGTDTEILKGVSFTLRTGSSYAFAGANGAGKTTVTKLLTGLYDGYEGGIYVDGRELRSLSFAQRKGLFSVVYQDYAKYGISLRDNLAMGRETKYDELQKALELAGADGLIEELEGGFDAPLGKVQKGARELSGGQWQRVVIARALCSPAPVRILDEPTAALDPLSESRLYEDFKRISEGMTTLMISHRLGSARLADEIFVIEDGRIAESGSHEELLIRQGVYAKMFEAQRSWYQ